MTKPSYEELERELEFWKGNCESALDKCDAWQKEAERVRGLLQRHTEALLAFKSAIEGFEGDIQVRGLAAQICMGDAIEKAKVALDDPANFPQSTESEFASSGVEGAHEGTTADKSGASPELLPTRLEEKK